MELRKATRKKAKIRLGLSAVSGAGKTYSALLIAKGLGGDYRKVAIIDTENGSADLYSHLGDYNVVSLEDPFTPEKYIEAIKMCEQADMEVIIVDSITHEWEWCTNENTRLGGRYQDWAKVTPRHDAFKAAMLSSKCHIITTVRRKQDYDMSKDGNGKIKVEKAGLKEQTRDGWEYELTANLELDINHNASASKDRTGLFADKPYFVPTEQTGELIKEWCENGVDEFMEAVKEFQACGTIQDLQSVWNKYKWKYGTDPKFIAEKEAMKEKLTPKQKASQQSTPSVAPSSNSKKPFMEDMITDELLLHLHHTEKQAKQEGKTFSIFGYIESLFIITPEQTKVLCSRLDEYEKANNLKIEQS